MTAGNVADGEGHGQHCKAEGESNTENADTEGELAASTALPQPPRTSQKVPINSAPMRLPRDMLMNPFLKKLNATNAQAQLLDEGLLTRI